MRCKDCGKCVLGEETSRIYRALNGLDIDEADERASSFVKQNCLDLNLPGGAVQIQAQLAANFADLIERLDKEKIECGACVHQTPSQVSRWDKNYILHPCAKYNGLDQSHCRENDCDNGRGGEKK